MAESSGAGPRRRSTAGGARAGAEEVALEVFDFEGSAARFYERLGYGTLMRRMHKPLR